MAKNTRQLFSDDSERLNFDALIHFQGIYKESVLKDAPYLIERKDFKQTIKNIRNELGIVEHPSNPQNAQMWSLTSTKHIDGQDWNKEVKKKYSLMQSAVDKVKSEFNLGKEWKVYIESLILQGTPTDRPWMPLNLNFEYMSVENNEIVIKLKPGLRYEEYRNTWKQIAPILGKGQRLNKPYTSQSEHMKMYEDKIRGMTYMEISKKYYPSNPNQNVEKVKKAILRVKKRLHRDK
ncbi:hypothetical protein EOL96_04850 [Candidatus Saccharibacteria bacterium]|nr:hypothetical protein [Candidatus Saccharibacteria bacterium]